MANINYISVEIIDYFRSNSEKFGTKIPDILNEINSNWLNKDYSSLVTNMRTTLNIIPEVLGYSLGNTAILCSGTPGISTSEKDVISNLDSIIRKIGNGVVHDTNTIGTEQLGLCSPAFGILLNVVIRISGDEKLLAKIKVIIESSEEQNSFKAIKDFFLSLNKEKSKNVFDNKITNFTCNLTGDEIVRLQQIANTKTGKERLTMTSNGNLYVGTGPTKWAIESEPIGTRYGYNITLEYL